MTDSIRERILQALTTRVSGQRGLEGVDMEDLPLTVVVEGGDTPGDSDYDKTRLVMPVTIARAVEQTGIKNDAWYTAANIQLAELIKTAFGSDPTFGGLAEGMDYTGGDVAVITDGAKGVAVQIFIDIRYAFLHGDPYNITEPEPEEPEEEE